MMSKNKLIITIIIAIISGILLAVILALIYSYTNKPKTNPTKNIILNMIGYTYTNQQIQPLIQSYEQLNPNISINYTYVNSNYNDYLLTRLHSNDINIIPDIFESKNSDQMIFTKYLTAANNNIVNETYLKDNFYNIYLRGLDQSGKIIGLPENLSPMILIYNKDIFSSQQVNPDDIFSSVESFNSKLTNLVNTDNIPQNNISSLNIGNTDNIQNSSDILQLFMLENQTQMNNNNYTANFANTEGIQAVQYYENFLKDGEFDTNWNTNSQLSDLQRFANGNLAMIFSYPSSINEIKLMNPKLNLGFRLYPSLVNPLTLGHYDFLGTYKNSIYKDESWKFIRYLTSNTSIATLSTTLSTINSYGVISPRKDILVSSNDKELTNTLQMGSEIAIDWNTPTYSETQDAFNTLINSLSNGTDISSLLGETQKAINTSLTKDIQK